MTKTSTVALGFLIVLGLVSTGLAQPPSPLNGVKKVVFLGDSITYSGDYISFLETYLRIKNPRIVCEFLDLGLPSETVSGLSEPGHAGGHFARPALKERLDRVLDQLKPDLVIACYGMNDGIYYPFSEDRFLKFQEGIKALRAHVEATGAKILHLTPPVFDPKPIQSKTLPDGLAEYPQPFEGYDIVLDRYSGWLLAQRSAGWDVVDIHGPMKTFLNQTRERVPNYFLAVDGVHIGTAGHWIIAREIMLHWGVSANDFPEGSNFPTILESSPIGTEVLGKVERKRIILRDAWLTSTGHKRPGIKDGVPLSEARERAESDDREIRKLLKLED
jgi:lysophospholipase L1-like esterase